jgi:ATP-dependent Lon protease
MKESARAALSYARSHAKELGIKDDAFKSNDIHIHVPAGAIPKDGPSAGVTMAASLVSALTGAPIDHKMAMTGEITLRGRVLPVGGIKEKILAARRAKVDAVLIPEQNEKDLVEIPKQYLKNLKIITVATVDEVLKNALVSKSSVKAAKSSSSPSSSKKRKTGGTARHRERQATL